MSNGLQVHSEKYCVFQCQDESFALPATYIRSVIPRPELAALPMSPPKLAGLAYVQKEFLPVFDLSEFLGTDSSPNRFDQQMLVLQADSGAWGILIDQVLGLESLEVSFSGPRDDANDWTSVNVGSASFREAFVSVIDAEDLYELLNQQLRSHWQQLTDAAAEQLTLPSTNPA